MTCEEFNQKFYSVFKDAMYCAEKARRYGLLSVEEDLDKHEFEWVKRDVFWYGMRFAIDGTDTDLIDKILSNLIDLCEDDYSKKLQTIKKEAVLSIQRGDNPRILFAIINSYSDLPLDDPLTKEIFDG